MLTALPKYSGTSLNLMGTCSVFGLKIVTEKPSSNACNHHNRPQNPPSLRAKRSAARQPVEPTAIVLVTTVISSGKQCSNLLSPPQSPPSLLPLPIFHRQYQ